MVSPLLRLRKLCLSLPETHEVEAWGEPTFRIKGGKIFAMYASSANHHGAGRHSVWIKATKDNQELMIRSQPTRFFKPPYVGPSGWIGVYLDKSPDWNEVAELLKDGWQQIAPKKLLKGQGSGQRVVGSGARIRGAVRKQPGAKSKAQSAKGKRKG